MCSIRYTEGIPTKFYKASIVQTLKSGFKNESSDEQIITRSLVNKNANSQSVIFAEGKLYF